MTAVLFVTNGHGEASIAARIARDVRALAPLATDHLALVGRGYLYDPPGSAAHDNLVRFGFLCRQMAQFHARLGRQMMRLVADDCIVAAMGDALEQPDVKAQLAKLDLFVEAETGKAAEDRISAQRSHYARIIKSTGMKIE